MTYAGTLQIRAPGPRTYSRMDNVKQTPPPKLTAHIHKQHALNYLRARPKTHQNTARGSSLRFALQINQTLYTHMPRVDGGDGGAGVLVMECTMSMR